MPPILKHIANARCNTLILFITFGLLIESHWTFENEHDAYFDSEPGSQDKDGHLPSHHQEQPIPKDKVLLKDLKTLTFYRNKRTTSRRTHSIHQLSCVGGTAGCKLFTPDKVECENVATPNEKTSIHKINWTCRADMSEKVQFNHVEVICEGYDYPEDDYILLGSCGLEFTLDYKDPHDYHDNSYFKQMDEHEKELHHDRVRKKLANDKQQQQLQVSTFDSLYERLSSTSGALLMGSFIFIVAILYTIVKFCSSSANNEHRGSNSNRSRRLIVGGYGPLTSAVMTTKKAC